MRDLEGAQFIAAGTPEHTRGFIGGLYSRIFIDMGVREGHYHHVDHSLFLLSGVIALDWGREPGVQIGTVVVEGPKVLGDPPTQIPVLAGAWHVIRELEKPAKWMCVFSEAEAEFAEHPRIFAFCKRLVRLHERVFGYPDPVAFTMERD